MKDRTAASTPCATMGRDLPSQLRHPFRIVAFDWDGTAVMSRHEDASRVRVLLERLLQLGVYVVVITGTNFPNVDRQLSAAMRGPHKQRLYILTNRGSEVYGFGADARPLLLWRRSASSRENRLLTEIADAIGHAVTARTGLKVRVVYNRLNRRKIDLIPLPEWGDPPKSALGELIRAVEARLKGAGLAGGLREVFALAEKTAREKGLPHARITSDVKHIEVGLTDKADAIHWMMSQLAQGRGIPWEDVLIGGDEFGPIAGFEGSDYKMVVPEARGATLVSVGPEPGGAPPEVIHLGGGPDHFHALLACQVAFHEQRQSSTATTSAAEQLDLPTTPSPDPGWLLVEEGFNLAREHEIESLFTVANGYVGTRGSLAEGSSLSKSATLVAGVYELSPDSGAVPELVLAPDWVRLRVVVAGHELKLEEGEFLEHRRMLDLRKGILWREWRHQDPAGRITRLRFLRLVSLADRHVLLQSVTLTPENYSGQVRLESQLKLSASGQGVNLAARLVESPRPAPPAPANGPSSAPDIVTLVLHAPVRGTAVAFAVASQLRAQEGEKVEPTVETGEERLVERWDWEVEIGQTYRLDRLVSVYTSRDVEQPIEAATRHRERLWRAGVEAVVADHVQAWESWWQAANVEIEGDEEAQRALRFAIYHLISAANPEDERVSIGARALTGGTYKGHIFWDTEIYMLPFYTFTCPPAARALLMYRYHTLPAAREKASRLGYRGALYAWESTDTGEETTPDYALAPDGKVVRILSGEQEHHISADIAYAAWQYWQASGDDAFFVDAGAEIILETARFWASRGRIEEDGQYHLRQVIGPDEYHEGVDDNAFTNVMAQWNLERGAETARLLAEHWPERWRVLSERLALTTQEPQEWLKLAEAMYTGFDPRTGLFEQFRGYFDLEEIDIAAYEPRTVPMDVLLGRERTQRSQVIKQPDVIMLIYLLWDRFPSEVRAANFRYYEPRTGHGSSLSPSIHALVAARLGNLALAQRYFHQAAEIDLANNMGNAAGGVHAAAQGGLWQAMVFGFAGLHWGAAGPAFEPHLLPRWHHLRFPVRWRGRTWQVAVKEQVDIS